MSWHYLRGQAGESSEDCCTGGEPLPPLKSKITHAGFYCNGKLTDAYLDSLYGTMFGHSTAQNGEEKLTSSAAVSLVRTFHAPEKEQGSQASAADSGKSLPGSFAKWDRDSCSWKTHQCSLFGGLELYSETWPRWGLMQDGGCLELSTPVHHTEGNGSGLFPTPRAQEPGATTEGYGRGLAELIEGKSQKRKDAGKVCTPPLTLAVKMWPTPTTQDAKNNGAPSQMERNTKPLNAEVGGQLNPDWVEWLMGWPIGWTDLKPLGMDRFRVWLRSHGKH